jgi:protein arginine kinase activator
MLCESCKQNEATIHITKITNGAKKETNLCHECAGKSQNLNLVSDMDIMTPFAFPNILSGLMEYVNKSPKNNNAIELKCKNCNLSYKEFKESGLLGCSQCYEYFKPAILSVIKGVQGNVEHLGKIPKKSGKELMQKKKVLQLREELQKAITLEEYEKAAELRDEIKGIEKDIN